MVLSMASYTKNTKLNYNNENIYTCLYLEHKDVIMEKGDKKIKKIKNPYNLIFLNNSKVFKKLRNNRRKLAFKKLMLANKNKSPPTIQIRNSIYLEILKQKILTKYLRRCSSDVRYYIIERINSVKQEKFIWEANMDEKDDAQGKDQCPDVTKLGNTLNEAQRSASKGAPAKKVPRKKKVFNKLASAESSPDYAALTDRFFPHKTYEWKKSLPFNTKIASLTLPADFVIEHPNAPNCTLFSSYAYWDGDIEVKLMVNSNKFQIGQLQMAWYYGQDYEHNFDRRDNIFTASQQAHCLVSAASSNEGLLYIPFRYYKPKMGTCDRVDDPGRLNMGKLTIRVLNPLNSPSTIYGACSITLSFRFVNSNFSGMKARDLGTLKANMFSSLSMLGINPVRAAMHVLEELDQDPQRDNPPDISPPNHMVPWSSHSWCVGDKLVEPINTLRLQAPGQTPHPAEVTPQHEEMAINYVVGIFGLITTVNWSSSMRSGDRLFDKSGSPIMEKSVYSTMILDNTTCFCLPPIAVVASLFAYWRGTIELRLDVIASAFHTGRLLISYIPRVLLVPTLEQAKSSPHAIFDLQGESRQFIFKIPYVSDRPWWHTPGFGNNVIAPSHIYCFVLNELVPMDNVANEVEINLYVRGCEDFEFSIPVVPRIGLSTYNAYVNVMKSGTATTKNGYTPMYVGEWRYVDSGTKSVLRYGSVTDHIVQFDNLKRKTVYAPDVDKNGQVIRGMSDVTVWYIVGVTVDADPAFCKYAAYFNKIEDAANYAKTEDNDKLMPYTRDTEFFDYPNGVAASGTIYFKTITTYHADGTREDCCDIETDDFQLIANMDERQSTSTTCTDSILPGVESTISGLTTFGERFDHFKALCRRYQLYTSINATVNVKESHLHRIVIPLLPQGYPRTNKEIDASEFLNLNREGLIPIVASAYRYYRGGLRFRIVWRSTWDCNIRLEHRPDERLLNYNTIVNTAVGGHKKSYNDGYAFLIQSTHVNRIIEFEIPFYQCGILGFLQNPLLADNLESYHYTLGNLYVGFSCADIPASGVLFDVYYSLADDCRFSVFQGFPPMMFSPDPNLVAQMGVFGEIKETISSFKDASKKSNEVLDKVNEMLPPKVEQPKPGTSKETDPSRGTTEEEEVKTSLFDWISKLVPQNLRTVMVNGVSQLVHCFINPTLKTISWAFASFLSVIGVLCYGVFEEFSKYFGKLTQWLFTYSERANQTKPGPIILEANMDDEMPLEIKAGLMSTVVTSIAAGMGAVGRLPKNIPDFMHGCWNNLGKFSMTSNHLCTFFKNNLTWITRAYKWVVCKVFPSKSLAIELQGADEELRSFAKEALILLDEANARKIEIHPKWNLRLYACAATAQALLIKMTKSEGAPRTPAILSLIREILTKRDELVKFQLSPPIRFEPFIMCFAGVSNVGKSFLCQKIGKDILKKIEYKTFEELIYTRTPGNPYWNQLRNQPICLYDDFIAIEGEQGIQQVAELFCLKSRAIFNPPQAEIKDKFIRYNPLLVFLATNQAFPKVPGVANLEAFYRRRDILIKVEKDQKFYTDHNVNVETGSPQRFKVKDIENFEHLRFRIALDVTNPATAYSNEYSYLELVKLLQDKFTVFYERELELYHKALKEAFDFFPDEDELGLTLSDDLEKTQQTLENINKFRYEHINELKMFLFSSIPLIKDVNDTSIPMLTNSLLLLEKVDKYSFDEIIKKYPIFQNSVMEVRLRLEANMADKPGPSGKKTPEIILRTLYCPHHTFSQDMDFVRENNEVKNGVLDEGYFSLARIPNARVSETRCTGDALNYCAWNIDDRYEKDMEMWMNSKYAHERRLALKNRDISALPFHFVKGILNKNPDARFETVNNEIQSWTSWAKNILSSLGTGLWETLKWAAKIVSLFSVVFGVAGLAYNTIYPEAAQGRMLEKGMVWNTAYQGTAGGLDAMHVVNAELMNKTHSSQLKYPHLNKDEGQMAASGDYKTFGKQTPAELKQVSVKLIGNMAKEQEMSIVRLIKRNTMFIQAQLGTKTVTGRIVGLVDHYALTISHYDDKLRDLPEDADIFLIGEGFKLRINYSDLKYKQFQDSGLGYYKLPVQVPPFRNILKHMARQKDHNHVGPLSRLVEPQEDWSVIISPQYCQRINQVKVEASNGFDAFVIPDGYQYQRGGRGVCGALLVSDHLEHPIYGIHVAGDIGGKIGISEALTYEQFEHLLNEVKINDVIEANMFDVNDGFMRPKSHVLVLGAIQKPFAHRETGVSKVIPTECNNEIFPNFCAPPVLHYNDERIKDNPFSPMQAGVNKHGLVTTNFPPELLELAAKDLEDMILAKVRPVRGCVGKLTKKVAIVGDPNVENFDKLDFNTSEGFPYVACRSNGQKSKSWLLHLEQRETGEYIYNGMDPILRDILYMKKQQRLRRELPFTVFTDCLKDRKLPIEKVLIPGKVRIFSISPLDYTIQCRQYFMDFSVSYQNARLDVEHGVGIDVNSLEWTHLARKLLEKGDNIVTADYSDYGPSLNAICAERCFKIIRKWYQFNGDGNSANDLMREMLSYEVIYSIHLVFGTMYRTLCGLPSGGPLTVILNTLVNCLYVRIAWLLSMRDKQDLTNSVNLSMHSFHKNLNMFAYGDDLIISVTNEALSSFNCSIIASLLSEYGIIIKNATKKLEIKPCSRILDPDTTFLKNNFVLHPTRKGLFLAALDLTSVQDTLNWTFKEWQHKLREISLEASDACIRNAYGHGPNFFDFIRDKVFEYWLRKQEKLSTPTWKEIDVSNFA